MRAVAPRARCVVGFQVVAHYRVDATTVLSAVAVPPVALVSQGSDGRLSLVLRPNRDWASVELTVGGDTFDLGPAVEGKPIEVEDGPNKNCLTGWYCVWPSPMGGA